MGDDPLGDIQRALDIQLAAQRKLAENHLEFSQGVIANLAALLPLKVVGRPDFFETEKVT